MKTVLTALTPEETHILMRLAREGFKVTPTTLEEKLLLSVVLNKFMEAIDAVHPQQGENHGTH